MNHVYGPVPLRRLVALGEMEEMLAFGEYSLAKVGNLRKAKAGHGSPAINGKRKRHVG